MKRMKSVLWVWLIVAMLALAAGAQAELGFAEVASEDVNFRAEPNGDLIGRLNPPQSVFVYDERESGGHTWCRVYTCFEDENRSGWIRSDMLRFISKEFKDVVCVNAGHHYVTGVREDGTVAIMGDDEPQAQYIHHVRDWTGIRSVSSWTCDVFGMDENGVIHTANSESRFNGRKAARMDGNIPILMDKYGQIMGLEWMDSVAEGFSYNLAPIENLRFAKLMGREMAIDAGLTTDGRVLCFGRYAALSRLFRSAPYRDADFYWHHIAALREDGTVEAYALPDYEGISSPKALEVGEWKNVVAIAAGANHTLGLTAEGRVLYAGPDNRHGWQIAAWMNVVQIDAGCGYSIALTADGNVLMAGAYKQYQR